MGKVWFALLLGACGLGVCAPAGAQMPPPAGAQTPPPAGADLAPPAFPGGPPPEGGYSPPAPPAGESAGCFLPPEVAYWPPLHVNVGYLFWFTRKQDLPPLVTTGSSLLDAVPGALGQPSTRVLLGDSMGPSFQEYFHSGVHARVQYDLGRDHTWSVDAGGFLLEQRSAGAFVSSNGAVGSAVLGRPFFNVNANTEDADPIAVPGVQSGTLAISMPMQLFGGDANLRYDYLGGRDQDYRLTFLAGGRYLRLEEKLIISESLQDLPGLGAAGNATSLGENFTNYNTFYGGQLGLDYEWHLGPVYVQAVGKVAFGETHQVQRNSAFATITEGTTGAVTSSSNRALLIQPSNAGQFSRDEFSIIPEGELNLGMEFNKYLRLSVGYNFLYWTRVIRPGNQIDRAVNVQALQPFDQIGIARPAVLFNNSNFWVQGVSANVEVSF